MKSSHLLLVVVACAANGCFAAPARSSGSTESNGVKMSILGQFCEDSIQPSDNDLGTLRMRLKIAVANRGVAAVTFDPARVKLVAPNGISPLPVEADSPTSVAPGETQVKQVRFMSRISVKCTQEMRLDPNDSIAAGAAHVALRPIAFVAQR